MYFEEYCLYAIPTILATGAVIWLYLKWKGRADKNTARSLLLSTAIAILIALLVPFAANLFYREVGLPVLASAAAAFAVLALLACLIYIVVTGMVRNKTKTSGLQESFGYAVEESAAGQENETPSAPGSKDSDSSRDETAEEKAGVHEAVGALQDETGVGQAADGSAAYDADAEQDEAGLMSYGTDPLQNGDDAGLYGEGSLAYEGDDWQHEVDTLQDIDKIGVEKESLPAQDVNELLNAAMDCKMRGDLTKAVSCYRKALNYIQEKELLTLVVLDLCGLAKMMKNTRIIEEVLDSEQGKNLDDAIKREILSNI